MGSFGDYFLFYGLVRFFYSSGLKASIIILSKILSAFSPGVWHEIRPCVHGTLRPLNWYSLSLFPLTKKVLLPLLDSGQLFSLFLLLSPVRRFVRTTISFTRVRLRGTDSLTYILYFLRQAGRSWPTFLIPLLTVSLWRPVNSNTEG